MFQYIEALKYLSQVIVELPLQEFFKKFDNIDNMKLWQPELISVAHLSGEPGFVGSKMKLTYHIGKETMEIIETITHRDLPRQMHAIYSSKGLDNIQKNYFESTSNGATKWIVENEFLPLTMRMRSMLLLMPKEFKTQSLKNMNNFKHFAEADKTIYHATT